MISSFRYLGIICIVLIQFNFALAQIDATDYDSAFYYDEETFNEVEYRAATDTSRVVARFFSEEKITELKSNPDLTYKEPPTVAESLWDRFWKWVGQFFSALFDGASTTNWGRVLVYSAALIGFILILMMILKVNAFKVFYSGADRGAIKTTVFHENIHEMDFERLIQEALNNKKYRNGIRLIFLYALKMLADKQYIQWQAGKTNHDYSDELGAGELKTNYNQLSRYFEYAWYGNFLIEEDAFKKAQQLFETLKQKTSA